MVKVTKTDAGEAVITWSPDEDDARGWIARAVESDWLEDALAAFGATSVEQLDNDEALAQVAQNTARVQAVLERRVRHLAVILRQRGLSWAQLASVLYDDPEMRSSARRVVDAGLRQMDLPATDDSDD